MFYRLDEQAEPLPVADVEARKRDARQAAAAPVARPPRGLWTAERTLLDSLAACMAVTILLELWRLSFASGPASSATLPWFAA